MIRDVLMKSCSEVIFVIFLLVITLLISSCGGGATTGEVLQDPHLNNVEWKLITINDKPVVEGTIAILTFHEPNKILGTTSCNLFAGTYTIGEGNLLNLILAPTTSWNCEEPYSAQEKSLLLALASTTHYKIEGDELMLTTQEGGPWGKFIKMEPLGLEGTEWYLDVMRAGQGVYVDPIESTQIKANFGSDGNLSGFAGCNDYDTAYVADSTDLSVGSITISQNICKKPGSVMDQESRYLTDLGAARTFRNIGIALILYDAEGQILVTYVSSDYYRTH